MDRCRSGTKIFLPEGDVEVALGYGDYLRGLEKLKVLPLKERMQHLKMNFSR